MFLRDSNNRPVLDFQGKVILVKRPNVKIESGEDEPIKKADGSISKASAPAATSSTASASAPAATSAPSSAPAASGSISEAWVDFKGSIFLKHRVKDHHPDWR